MQRVQRKRISGFKLPANTVCVTRPSKHSNPFRLTKSGTIEFYTVNRQWARWSLTTGFTQADIVSLFIKWRQGEIKHNLLPLPPTLEETKADLAGKNIACFCACGAPCHADYLLQIANEK